MRKDTLVGGSSHSDARESAGIHHAFTGTGSIAIACAAQARRVKFGHSSNSAVVEVRLILWLVDSAQSIPSSASRRLRATTSGKTDRASDADVRGRQEIQKSNTSAQLPSMNFDRNPCAEAGDIVSFLIGFEAQVPVW